MNINDFEDQDTWDLISSGKTKGVFQLESKLGSSWAKRVKPRNIEELADLISIIRPGTLEAMLDGKSMTMHYVDRKWKIDEVKYVDNALQPLLSNTYGIIVYQEQAMKIATALAGFTPEEADSLRKAMGKKDAALMKEVREKFVNGCKNQKIVSDTSAAQIFDWIQASARYSFNKSHAVAYAINSFRSAYCKTHSPLRFYEAYLNNAHNKPDKQKEIKELIMDAKLSGIDVLPPRLDFLHRVFTRDEDKNIIYFGYSNVKSVGEGEQEKIEKILSDAQLEAKKSIKDFTWLDCLFLIGNPVKKNAFISMISVGAFLGKNNKLSRNAMLFEYDIWNKLTVREQNWVIEKRKQNNCESFISLLKMMINENEKINSKRMAVVLDLYQALENPPYSIEDDFAWIAEIEQKLMGCALTCSTVDMKSNDVNITCAEIAKGEVKAMKDACLAIRINEVKEYTLKRGQNIGRVMGFMSGEDSTGELDTITLFCDEFEKFKKLLFIGNTVLLYGEVQEKKDKSFVVKNIVQI